MRLEIEHRRALQGQLEYIVGPYAFFVAKTPDSEVWIFGEAHHRKELYAAVDSLDAKRKKWNGKVKFSGNNGKYMEAQRFIYAASTTAYKLQTRMDVFLEIPIGKHGVVGGLPVDLRLAEMQLLFFPCQYGMIKQCDFSPYVQFHAADFRQTGCPDLFLCLKMIMQSLLHASHETLKQIALALIAFERKVPRWRLDWMNLVLNNNNILEDGPTKFQQPCQELAAAIQSIQGHFVHEAILYMLTMFTRQGFYGNVAVRPNGKSMHRLRAEYLGLAKESSSMADAIAKYCITLLEPVSFMTLFQSKVIDLEPLLDNSSLIMDIGLLFRLFRSFGQTPTPKKIVYVGAAHMKKYARFFEHVMKYPIIMKSEDDVPGFDTDTGSINIGHHGPDAKRRFLDLIGE